MKELHRILDSFESEASSGGNARGSRRSPAFSALFGPPMSELPQLYCALAGSFAQKYPEDRSVILHLDPDRILTKSADELSARLSEALHMARTAERALVIVPDISEFCPKRSPSPENAPSQLSVLAAVHIMTLIAEAQRANSNIRILATTIRPWDVDPGVWRCTNPIFIGHLSAEEIADYFANSSACDCFGYTQEECRQQIARIAALCAEKRCLAYDIGRISHDLNHKSIIKTLTAYPDGNPELTHVLTLSEDEIDEVIASANGGDFYDEYYQRYLDFAAR